MTKQSFNIQLLCAALLFTSATTHSNPLRVAFRRLSSSVPTPIVAEQAAAEQVALSVSKEPNHVSLSPTITQQLDLIQAYSIDMNSKLDAMKRKNKVIGFLSLIMVAETAYLIHDEFSEAVNKPLDVVMKNVNVVTKSLKELKDTIINSVSVKTPGASDSKNELPAPTTPIEQTPQDNNQK